MLDSPERVCAGQAWFEYPATFVLLSKCSVREPELVGGRQGSGADVPERRWSQKPVNPPAMRR